MFHSKSKAPISLETIAESLKEILARLDRIEVAMKHPEDKTKLTDWWKTEYIDAAKGYRGITLLMALATAETLGFDTVEQWRNACVARVTSEIPRSTFFVLRNELRDLDLINKDLQTLTVKGKIVTDELAKSPFPVVTKKHLIHIIENL